MAAGDWLLGCIPLQETDTGLFNRAYYLSGSYGLWRPVLTVGLGAIGGFLYYFVVKALNADIDGKYRKTKNVQFLCGIFTVAIALTIHTWVATMAWFATYLGPRIGAEAALAAVTTYQDAMLPAILPLYRMSRTSHALRRRRAAPPPAALSRWNRRPSPHSNLSHGSQTPFE